jgi:hypothetical protein
MANRSMQAKMLKLKASRRKAHLKRPRSGGVDAGKTASHEIFQNRARVNTTSGKTGEQLPILDNTWAKDLPTKDYVNKIHNKFIVYNPETKTHDRTPRGDVNVRLKEIKRAEQSIKDEGSVVLGALRLVWQGKWGQGVTTYNTIKVLAQGDLSIKLYFSGQDFRFVQETCDTRWISKQYHNHKEAMAAYKTRVVWISEEEKKE